MPSLGTDMERGTVVEWLVQPGQSVRRGDVVAVVDTDKATIEVEVFEDGVIGQLLVPVGAEVPVGTPLAQIIAPEGAADAAPVPAPVVPPFVALPEPVASPRPVSPAPVAPPVPLPVPVGPPVLVPAALEPADGLGIVVSPVIRHEAEHLGVDLHRIRGTGPGGRIRRADLARAAAGSARRVRSSPLARRLASRHGMDLAALSGTGPAGAVRAVDVERVVAAAAAPAAEPAVEALAPATPDRRAAMRTAIANLMSRSQREIPHYYLSTTIDMRAAFDWLAATNADRPPEERLVPAALLLKATARAAAEVPGLNGFWVDGGFRPAPAVHLGVAISLRGGGLVAPAIHDCDHLPVEAVMAALRDLVARSRNGKLRSSEMADPTITVTNLGDHGAESVYGVIYPPQVALVGFGRIVERPWAAAGLLGVHPVVTATLAADHRASDGHLGGLLLAAIDRLLLSPDSL